jgi:chemotaxis signal transduction protein
MSVALDPVLDQAATLRAAFDESFSRPLARGAGDRIGFVALRIGDSRFALRGSEVAALIAHPRIVPVPGSSSELLGLAGARGAVVAVYELAAMLRCDTPPAAPAFLALAVREPSVAFAWSEFEGYLEMDPNRLHPVDGTGFHGESVREGFYSDGVLRHVVEVASLLDRIRDRSQARRG